MSQKKKHANVWNITIFFYTNKENKKKNKLIKNKGQIENTNIRIIKWLQQFHNKSYTTSC